MNKLYLLAVLVLIVGHASAQTSVTGRGTLHDPIIDSRMTEQQAFDGLDPKCPDGIRKRQRLITLKYYSFDKAHETTVQFFNAKGQLLRKQKQKLIYGDNFIRFELNHQFQEGQIYRIEVADLENRLHAASFSINKPTN